MNRFLSKCSLRVLVALTVAVLVSAQALAAPNPAAAEAQRASAASFTSQAATLLAAAEKLPAGENKAASIAHAQAAKAIADARLELAEAYEAGDNDAIRATTARITETNAAFSMAGRVAAARRTQDTYADTAAIASWDRATRAAATPQLDAAKQARAATAAAYGAAAEVGAKTTDANVMSEAEDTAIKASYDYNVAVRAWQYANDIAVRREAAVAQTNAAYRQMIDRIEAHQAKVLDNLRAQYEATLADRKMHRERSDMLRELAEIATKK